MTPAAQHLAFHRDGKLPLKSGRQRKQNQCSVDHRDVICDEQNRPSHFFQSLFTDYRRAAHYSRER